MTDFLATIDEFLASFTEEEHATRVVFRSLLEGRGIRPEAVAVTLGTSLTAIERAVDDLIERGMLERDADSGELVGASRAIARRDAAPPDGRRPGALRILRRRRGRHRGRITGRCAGRIPLSRLRRAGDRGALGRDGDRRITRGRHLGRGTGSYAFSPPLHVTAHQLLLLGRASQELRSERAVYGPPAHVGGDGRGRTAPLGRDAMNHPSTES